MVNKFNKTDSEYRALAPPASLYSIKAIIILDIDGKRTLAKYYDDQISQRSFEKNIFTKTHRSKDEIVMVDGLTVLHKSVTDLHLYVVGGPNENPLLLASVLDCLKDCIESILHKNVERRTLLESLDGIILAIDEICDGGVIIETDKSLVTQRVSLKDNYAEQSVAQVFQQARDFKWSLLR